MPKNRFIVLALLLFFCNLILGGVVFFNYRYQQQLKSITPNKEILGASGAIPTFSPNFIMSDETFRSTRVFPTQASVQSYLDRVRSPLRNYTSSGQTASYWIFNASRGVTSSKNGITPSINPAVLIAYLEKEQSLISLQNYDTYNDPESRIKTAMGYGCFDLQACQTSYFGLANQLNWAAFQLELNFQQASNGSGKTPYSVNKTITTLDEYNVFLTNAGTASQYRYTPHVYWGNYNLWKIITANGWGVSGVTYSPADIDAKNLANKDIKVGGESNFGISQESILPILRSKYSFGDSNESIKTLQRFLRQEGYYMNREINGMYGTLTKNAHESYLNDHSIAFDLGVSGQVSNECKGLINKDWSLGVNYGEEGKKLQQCLRDMKLFDWPVNTGVYGEVTNKALVQGRLVLGETNVKPATVSCEALKTMGIPFGETSARVRQLQACMRQAGVFTWPQGDTGYYGPVTQEAFGKWTDSTPKTQTQTNQTCENLKKESFALGQSGELVRQLQACMRQAGVFTWPNGDTGYYGPVTQEAFGKWANRSIVATFSCTDLKSQTWIKGETSARVRQLQACMRQAGVFTWPQGDTGYFGEETEKSIIKWRGYL